MYDLQVIISMNNRTTVRSAVSTRDCSFNASRGGYVLHSARARDTIFLSGVPAQAFKEFLATNPSQAKINTRIESIYTKYQSSI